MPRARKKTDVDTASQVRRKLKKEATRINDYNPAEFMPYKSDKANAAVRQNSKFTPRKRDPNEALPITNDWRKSVYRTGDGDILQLQRPGSDLSWIKSHGTQT